MALTKCNFLPLDRWVQVQPICTLHPLTGLVSPCLSCLSCLFCLTSLFCLCCLTCLTHLRGLSLKSHSSNDSCLTFFASFLPLQSTYLLVQLVIVTATAIRSQRTTEQHLFQASRLSQCQFRSVFAVLILGKTCFSQFKFFSWSE